MSERTDIEWCDSTANFWSGCAKVSAGCAHCYAETLSNRNQGPIGKWGNGAPRRLHESAFKLAEKLNRKSWVCENCGRAGLTDKHGNLTTGMCVCQGTTSFRRWEIFSLSLGDWLDPEVPIEWLARMLDTIRRCDQVRWLLLTKRPELFHERLGESCDANYWGDTYNEVEEQEFIAWVSDWQHGIQVPQHIAIGTSVENQKMADLRVPQLLRIPAHRRFLSLEPLLGPVVLPKNAMWCSDAGLGYLIPKGEADNKIHQIIIGGESGPKARPCNIGWIRSLVKQGKAAGVRVFVKQLGANPNDDGEFVLTTAADRKNRDTNAWPEELRVQERLVWD